MAGAVGGLVSHIVDAVGLVRLTIGVDSRGVVSLMGETFFLSMFLFVAVPADDVGVAGAAVVGLAVVTGQAVVIFGWKSVVASLECSNLLDFLLSQILPNDVIGFFWLKLGLSSGDFVQPFVVVLDGFQVAGHLHAFIEGSFLSLQNLVADAILKPSEEELMLDEFEGVRNAFSFSFLDSSHGGGLVVSEVLVGHLDMVGVVIDGLVSFLGEFGEVGAGGLGGVLVFVALQELGLDHITVVHIKTVLDEPFKQTNSLVPETHLKLEDLLVNGPAGDGGGIINADNEQVSSDGISAWLAIEERDVG